MHSILEFSFYSLPSMVDQDAKDNTQKTFSCPVSGLEFNGRRKYNSSQYIPVSNHAMLVQIKMYLYAFHVYACRFFAMRECGCVISLNAMETMKDDKESKAVCIACQKKFSDQPEAEENLSDATKEALVQYAHFIPINPTVKEQVI